MSTYNRKLQFEKIEELYESLTPIRNGNRAEQLILSPLDSHIFDYDKGCLYASMTVEGTHQPDNSFVIAICSIDDSMGQIWGTCNAEDRLRIWERFSAFIEKYSRRLPNQEVVEQWCRNNGYFYTGQS